MHAAALPHASRVRCAALKDHRHLIVHVEGQGVGRLQRDPGSGGEATGSLARLGQTGSAVTGVFLSTFVGNVIVNCSPQQSRYALVIDGAGGVATYALDSASGRLSFVDVAPTGSGPSAIVVAPSGLAAYLTDAHDGTVFQYAVGADGSLTPLSPAAVPAGTAPHGIAVDPAGRFAYAVNNVSNDITEYAITGGALTKTGSIATGMPSGERTPRRGWLPSWHRSRNEPWFPTCRRLSQSRTG
jgi:DNA-binding beta-propeller fold protein YncE